MALRTRKPTGSPSWPLILLAGVEGSGKSWIAAEATGMDGIDQSFFLEIGEAMADEYIKVDGADYVIVEHDGSYRDILSQLDEAVKVVPAEGKANMLVIDSATELWDLLGSEQQEVANKRRGGRPGDEKPITMDQWNVAKKRWAAVLDLARAFPGPVLITARLDQVVVVENGKPTEQRAWKIRAEKNLPYEVQVVMQARSPRKWVLTKIASTELHLDEGGEMPLPSGISIAQLLERMKVTSETVTGRSYVRPNTGADPDAPVVLPEDFDAQVQAAEEGQNREELVKLHGLASASGNQLALASVTAAARRAGFAKPPAAEKAAS